MEITNDGETLVDVLVDIAFADTDDSKVTPYCRSQAGRILSDRSNGTDPASVRNGLCPSCRRKWTTHPDSSAHPEHVEGDSTSDSTSEEFVPDPGWVETLHEIKRMEDEGIIDNVEYDPFNPKSRMTGTEEEIAPYADEVAAKYRAELDLQAERRAKWPEIEERRRKKLAKIYPSHSDGDPPDT